MLDLKLDKQEALQLMLEKFEEDRGRVLEDDVNQIKNKFKYIENSLVS